MQQNGCFVEGLGGQTELWWLLLVTLTLRDLSPTVYISTKKHWNGFMR